MIIMQRTAAGLVLTHGGIVGGTLRAAPGSVICGALDTDPAGLAETIRDLVAGREPRHIIARPAQLPRVPLFAARDAEDRRRAALAEERAQIQLRRAAATEQATELERQAQERTARARLAVQIANARRRHLETR